MANKNYDEESGGASANWTRDGIPGNRRFKELNRPPQSSSWAWMTAEMLYSKAWGALPADAIKFIMRVVAEHLKHGGVANGKLPVTYGDLNKIGLHNDKARRAILVAIGLSFIDKAPQLVRPRNIRAPNLYGLIWLPTCDGSPPTNRRTRFQDRDGALMAVRRAKLAASLNRRRDTGTNRTRTSRLRT